MSASARFSLTLLMVAVSSCYDKRKLSLKVGQRNATTIVSALVVVAVSSIVLGSSTCPLKRSHTYTDHTVTLANLQEVILPRLQHCYAVKWPLATPMPRCRTTATVCSDLSPCVGFIT